MSAPSSQSHTGAGAAPLGDHSRRNRTQDSSSSSRWRFNRSSTNLHQGNNRIPPTVSTPAANPPLKETKIERTPSKMSLFNLFSRPKVEKARGHTEAGLDVPVRPQTPTKKAPITSSPKSSLRHNPSSPAQQTIRSRSSQMFRPMSMRPTPLTAEFGTWEPPPLFQALSQSIKHATVQACVFPPEVLMRTQSQRRQFEQLRDRMDHVRDLSTISEIASEAKKLEKTHKRFISNSSQNSFTPELVDKVYVLVPTGYILQYTRSGPFDRSPEKVLKLGKESAAFACDLIPGKHWVLQISSRAHDDGTIEPGPRNNLLARLRSQNSAVRKGASSFLLVLESAEEMDAWMTSVRREIDSIAGIKIKEEDVRASTSIDEAKASTEITNPVDKVQRDHETTTKSARSDSPPHSQYSGSPKIVASDWETEGSVRTASLAESSSEYSSRRGTTRQSIEMASTASTPVSQYQVQLDQLRRRSRFSFVSNGTTVSGPGTRNTSPDSSPVSHSPVKEDASLMVEPEPLRSAMSLKSFHMNPSNNSVTSRRRSMQPLPVTDEHFPSSSELPAKRQRHSLYACTLPAGPGIENLSTTKPILLPKKPPTPQALKTTENVTPHIVTAQSAPLKIQTELMNPVPVTVPTETREDSPLRPNGRSYSIPPRVSTISPPPPHALPPMPPRSAPRQSMIGTLQADNQHPAVSASPPAPVSRAQQRLSATPKPFFRPLPIRPQAQHRDGSIIVPRRQSSLTPSSAPAPLPLGISISRSVTAPARPPSEAAGSNSTLPSHMAQAMAQPLQALHRQSGAHTRSDQVPVLAPRRVRAISSMPSFVPGRRSSNAPTSAPRQLQSPSSIDMLKQRSQSQSMQKGIISRQSMTAIGLPPPAPPPNMPLPSLPSHITPVVPSHMPPPVPPPNMPLPPPPMMATPKVLST